MRHRQLWELVVRHHQGRCLDQRQDRAHVDLQQRPQVGPHHPFTGDGPLQPGRPAPEPIVARAGGHIAPREGLGAPQLVGPGDRRLGGLARNPDRVVVGDQVPGGGVDQDQRGGALRLGPGENSAIGPASGPAASRAARCEPAASMAAVSSWCRPPTAAAGFAGGGRRRRSLGGQSRSAARTRPAGAGTGPSAGLPRRCRRG
jgi:hypothetical protein